MTTALNVCSVLISPGRLIADWSYAKINPDETQCGLWVFVLSNCIAKKNQQKDPTHISYLISHYVDDIKESENSLLKICVIM